MIAWIWMAISALLALLEFLTKDEEKAKLYDRLWWIWSAVGGFLYIAGSKGWL